MIKEIRTDRVVCECCKREEHFTIYEVYCDQCNKLISSGPTYGIKIEYTVWDNDIKDFDESHYDNHFCSYKCLFAKLAQENVSGEKRIHIDINIDKDCKAQFLENIRHS